NVLDLLHQLERLRAGRPIWQPHARRGRSRRLVDRVARALENLPLLLDSEGCEILVVPTMRGDLVSDGGHCGDAVRERDQGVAWDEPGAGDPLTFEQCQDPRHGSPDAELTAIKVVRRVSAADA